MGIDLEHLRTFEALVETGSFTRAARRLFISQPTASRHIRQLEQACGARLVERGGKEVRLTPAGERLALYGRQLLALSREALLEASQAERACPRVVRIGSGVTTAMVILPQALQAFRRRYPGIRILVKTGRVAALIEQVVSGELDLAVVTCDGPPTSVRAIHLFDETLVLVAHPGYWLSHRPQPVEASLLDRCSLLAFSPDVGHRRYLDRVLGEAGVRPEITMELDNVALILRYVRMKAGVAFIPLPAALDAMREGELRLIQVRDLPEMVRHKYVLLREREPRPAPVEALLQHLCTFSWDGTRPAPAEPHSR